MRKQEEVIGEIIKWAEKNDDIRAVILTGSRANPINISDLLSEYDIEIVITDANTYLNSDEWLLTLEKY